MKKIKFLLLFAFVNLIIFELFSLSICNLLNLCSSPSYSLRTNNANHWVNHDLYGVWHKPNSSYIHKSDCFSAKYNFNNFGAKDIKRTINGKNRTLLIGDSYVEGYGVDNDKIFSYLIENNSKHEIEYLNFSSSGYFGSTQYYLLINDLLKKIEFDRVILFLNPDSDFEDDSIDFGKIFHNKKYRPYYDLNTNKIFYYNQNYRLKKKNLVKDILDEYTYSYKLLRYTKQQLVLFNKKKKINNLSNINEGNFVSYFDKYPKKTFKILKKNLFNINNLLLENDIKLIVSTLPSKKDTIYFNRKNNSKNNLDNELKKYLDKMNVKFFEIMQTNLKNNKIDLNSYFTCNNHFNADGHRILANIIEEKLLSIEEKY
tara:strand:+ start:515 stop:1627 length:1113 start_codon:yes stop_codon:yes gene_type:complete